MEPTTYEHLDEYIRADAQRRGRPDVIVTRYAHPLGDATAVTSMTHPLAHIVFSPADWQEMAEHFLC